MMMVFLFCSTETTESHHVVLCMFCGATLMFVNGGMRSWIYCRTLMSDEDVEFISFLIKYLQSKSVFVYELAVFLFTAFTLLAYWFVS